MSIIKKTEDALLFLKKFDVQGVINVDIVSYHHVTRIMVRNHSEVKRVLNVLQPGSTLDLIKNDAGYLSKVLYCNIELYCVSEDLK